MANTSGIKAGRAFVVVEAVDKTGTVLNRIASGFKKISNTLLSTGTKGLFGGLFAMAPMAGALKIFTEFDDAMLVVKSRAKGTETELSNLREQAKELGRTTSFTTPEVAKLMAVLASMDFNRGDIAKMTEDILNLSRVSGAGPNNTNDAAFITAAVMKQYKMEASDSKHVTDLLAVSLTSAKWSFEELGVALQYAGNISKETNVPLEDLITTATMLKQAGLEASMIGSGLRNAILNMSNATATTQFNQELSKLTGTMVNFNDAAGNLKNPADLLFSIGEALKDVGTANRASVLEKLFGKRGVIVGLMMSTSKNPFEKLSAKFAAVNGEAKRLHNEMDSGIGGSWRRFTSAIEGVAVQLGETLKPAIMSISTIFEDNLRVFVLWMKENERLVMQFTLVSASIIPLSATLIALGIAAKLVSISFALMAVPFTVSTALMAALGVNAAIANAQLLLTVSSTLLLRGAMLGLSVVLLTVGAATPILLSLTRTIYNLGRAFIILASGQSVFASSTVVFTILPKMVAGFLMLTRAVLGTVAAFFAFVGPGNIFLIIFGAIASIPWALITGFMMLTRTMIALWQSMSLALTFLSLWRGIFLLTVGTITLLTSKVVIIAAIIAGLGYLLYRNRQTIFNSILSVCNSLKNTVIDLGAGFTWFFDRAKRAGLSLWETLTKVFSGVSDALLVGNTAMAWEITLKGMEITWYEFVNLLQDSWKTFSDWFTGSLMDEWPQTMAFIQDSMKKTMEFLTALWADFKESISGIAEIIEYLTTGKIDIGEPAGSPKPNTTGKPGDAGYDPNYDPSTDPFAKSGDEVALERIQKRRKAELDEMLQNLELDKQIKKQLDEAGKVWDEVFSEKKLKDDMTAMRALLPDNLKESQPAMIGEIKAFDALQSHSLETLKELYELRMSEQFEQTIDVQEDILDATSDVAAAIRELSDKIEVA